MLAMAVSALGSAVAHAAPPTEQVTVRVRYDDLDLSRAAGAVTLRQRIHAAASDICGAEPSISDLGRQSLYRECMAQAEASADIQTAQAMAAAHRELARR
jgi:UrcA family protein